MGIEEFTKELKATEVIQIGKPGALNISEALATRSWFDKRRKESMPKCELCGDPASLVIVHSDKINLSAVDTATIVNISRRNRVLLHNVTIHRELKAELCEAPPG